MALSERRFDARVVAVEAITGLAKGDEDPAILLENAGQIEDWLMREGPAEEEEHPAVLGWLDEVRQPSHWDRIRFGRGA